MSNLSLKEIEALKSLAKSQGLEEIPLGILQHYKIEGAFTMNAITSILSNIFTLISPELKGLVDGLVKDLYAKAQATPNPWDNIAVGVVATLLGVDLSK